jgi:glucose-6-phosphate isomerase
MNALQRLVDADAVARLHARDVTLFSADADVQTTVANRLGWIDLARQASSSLPQITDIAGRARAEGVTDVVLLGMGGSSLASLVISRVLGTASARMHVLDTVSPITVRRAIEELDPATTLYVVASKSGGTIEPNALYAIFRAHVDSVLGDDAGNRFIAVTDPGSSLEALAHSAGFRDVVSAPSNVGGRFSALTVFGLVPAALIGVDVAELLARGSAAEDACASPADENPAVELAAFIVDSHDSGADKLTVVADEGLRSFGLWVEQLVAESLGKLGTGVIPVVELSDTPRGYGADRAIVVVRMTGDDRMAEWAASQRGRHPIYEIVLDDVYDIAEEFVRWEHAVALCGHLLGINPFDEPNVAEAKAATIGVLDGSAPVPQAQEEHEGFGVTFGGGLPHPGRAGGSVATAVGHVIASLERAEYLAVLAYLPDDDALLAPLSGAVPLVSAATGAAVTLELGPRYLHSTGQLHKGGPATGVFILVTTRDEADLDVPGHEWSLGTLHRAQAEGDLVTLAAHGRRALRLDLPDASHESVRRLANALLDGAGVIHEG